jgi:hypothetical protein
MDYLKNKIRMKKAKDKIVPFCSCKCYTQAKHIFAGRFLLESGVRDLPLC